ncbi:MAG: hypothetical protein QM783_17565 [Phycisphaerales bacterium]
MTGGSLADQDNTTLRGAPWVRALVLGACSVALVAAGGCRRVVTSADPHPLSPGRVIGGPGGEPGNFIKPRAIDTDGKNLVVIDRSGRIQILEPEKGRCLAYWKLPYTELGYPTGVTLAPSPKGDGAEAVWVADTHYNRVLVYAMPPIPTDGSVGTTQPELLLTIGKYGTGPGEFTYPSDVLVLCEPDGKTIKRVYIPEFGGNDRISIFEPRGADKALTFVSAIGHGGDAADLTGFQRPQTVILRPGDEKRADELLITDSINHRVGRFDLEGKLIKWFNGDGQFGREPGKFCHPRGLLMLEDGTAMVVEFGNNRLQRIDLETGECLGLYGAPAPKKERSPNRGRSRPSGVAALSLTRTIIG